MKDLTKYAVIGVRLRLIELEAEMKMLTDYLRTHKDDGKVAGPDLGKLRKKVKTKKRLTVREARKIAKKVPEPKKRSTMSPAMRKSVSKRMKKYWANRRKAKVAEKS